LVGVASGDIFTASIAVIRVALTFEIDTMGCCSIIDPDPSNGAVKSAAHAILSTAIFDGSVVACNVRAEQVLGIC
jgi:hypothetical protein